MKLLFVGVQGSGKGTQAKIISEKLRICHISTGDLLRETSGDLGKEIHSYIDNGNMIPDELMIRILENRMKQNDCQNGYILDGFPRNLAQAYELDKRITIDKVVEIDISDSESLKRLSGRVSCENCKAGYNIYTAPKPQNEGVCNYCNGRLIQRADDNPEAIKKRIADYHNKTEPILEHYKDRVVRINGEQSIEKISEDILDVLKN